MFGLFSKNRKALVEPRVVPTSLQMVPVRRSAFEGELSDGSDLVQDVTQFVVKMQGEVTSFEIQVPPLALQSYRAEQYVSQVRSGGHERFVENCGEAYDEITRDALAGLKAMAAHEQAELLEDMMSLVPSDTLVEGIAEELSILDDELMVSENDGPMVAKNAAWIRGWLILQVLDDEDYSVAIQNPVSLNLMDGVTSVAGEAPSEFTEPQKRFASMRKSEGDQELGDRL
jgi:hypothetical protein